MFGLFTPSKEEIKEMIKDFNKHFKIEANIEVLESHIDNKGRTIIDKINLLDVSIVNRKEKEEVKNDKIQ